MQKKEEIIVYQNPDPLLVSKQGIFPGVSLLPNNNLLIIFSIGQAFDSSDQRAFVTKSRDNGRTWSKPKQLHDYVILLVLTNFFHYHYFLLQMLFDQKSQMPHQ